MSGKGDKPRPMSVPRDEFNKKWDKIDWTKNSNNKKQNTTVKKGVTVKTTG